MKKWTLVAAAVTVVVGVSGWRLLAGHRSEWTTSSPQALAEFQAGMEDRAKLYTAEARQHFERALELDPSFAMARLQVAFESSRGDEQSRDRIRAVVDAAELGRLTPRERFLFERTRAELENRRGDVARLLDRFLEQHPEDPYALHAKAVALWFGGSLDEAKLVYQRLARVAPNWVLAYNGLAYIEMQQGNFEQAEEYFFTYRFIAPDQANPHDSLGELLILTGRYQEAESELEAAVITKPDFCAAYEHLVWTHLLQRRPAAAAEDVRRASQQQQCADYTTRFGCVVSLWEPAAGHRWRDVVETAEREGCMKDGYPLDAVMLDVHRAAAMLGDHELCDRIESRLEEWSGRAREENASMLAALWDHTRGVRQAAAGHLVEAARLLREADQGLTYRQSTDGTRKLLNRLCLAEVLRKAGDAEGAVAAIREVRRVNPPLAQEYESGRWCPLGL
ncbi:MAG: hypothetical protein LJE95_09375 [Acidobacteria bacterium]|nr:hypothetical protein [Acidobacteriota bacterium]